MQRLTNCAIQIGGWGIFHLIRFLFSNFVGLRLRPLKKVANLKKFIIKKRIRNLYAKFWIANLTLTANTSTPYTPLVFLVFWRTVGLNGIFFKPKTNPKNPNGFNP